MLEPHKSKEHHLVVHRTMTTIVTKSAPLVVRPSQPTPTENIELSSLDKSLDGLYLSLVLVFDHPIHETAQTLKSALSQALVHYYPIAGRIEVAAEDGKHHLACNGEGVLFVAASANATLEHVRFIEQPFSAELLKDLTVCSSGKAWSHADPLLLMQVTEFACGGFVVAVTWNHVVADGQGMGQFMVAVGELARGLSQLSVVPFRCVKSLPVLSPLTVSAFQQMLSLDRLDLSNFDITLPSGLISSIKSDYASNYSGRPCTQFEVTAAVLWQCRTRAAMLDPGAPAPFFFAVNMRKCITAKEGFYGNFSFTQVVFATSDTVVSSPTRDLVKLIKDAKEKISDVTENNIVDSTCVANMERLAMISKYNAFSITSWRNLGFEAVNFGSGTPARVTCTFGSVALPFCILCPSSKVQDGAIVVSMCVNEEHTIGFLNELARLCKQN